MIDTQRTLERELERLHPPRIAFEQLERRRDRKQRNQRAAAGVLGIAVFAIAAVGLVRLLGSEGTPASDQRSPFAGEWISTTDGNGSTQRMIVTVSVEGAVEVVVTDDFAPRCEGSASTMTGSGRIEDGTTLVIPTPEYTCDAGRENPGTPPLDETLRDWTLVLDPGTDTLSDSLGGVWVRKGTEAPSPVPAASGQMWPQTSYQEVVKAQERADAGDPRYTWQVDPQLASDDTLYPWDSEIVERFLREGLGWEEWAVTSGNFAGQPGVVYDEVVLIRCAPGQTNPLYPEMPADVRGCTPTIDDYRYETVMIRVEQPGLRGPSGVWAVTGWQMLQPAEPGTFHEHLYPQDFGYRQVEQVAPPSDAEVTALLQAFLGARVDGEGAERYVHRHPDGWDDQEVPVLYATTGGSPYERYEIDRLRGPMWPTGWIEFRVRLFADDGIEVEQTFVAVRQEDGRLGLMYGVPEDTDDLPTLEDGQPIPVPYRLLDGEVTFDVATPDLWEEPWDGGAGDLSTFMLFGLDRSSMTIMADPLPVDAGCEPGPAPADAEALARIIASNPHVEANAPVAVRVAGVDALQIDVAFVASETVRPGCRELGLGSPVVEGTMNVFDDGRMRLYLLDLPEGMSARILGIAIAGPEVSFEGVMEAAAPTLDSFEFHTR